MRGEECSDCPWDTQVPHKLYDVAGVSVCVVHAARREGITQSAWHKRRVSQAKRDRLNPDGARLRKLDTEAT